MHNIKLVVAYDGTAYKGWQKTPMGSSIEGTLQNVLEQIVQHPVALQAASRTDAGVHAIGQVVNFLTDKAHADLGKLQHSLNSLLPTDIRVTHIEEMPPSFHPTLQCTGKEYRYYVCSNSVQLPHHRLYEWYYPYSLDLNAMRDATQHLIGTHNFAAFCNVKKNEAYADYIREVTEIDMYEEEKDRLYFRIVGKHFLYKMVRNMVGTLVYIGRGTLTKDIIPLLLSNKDRTQAGMTAPAHGLFLYSIFY